MYQYHVEKRQVLSADLKDFKSQVWFAIYFTRLRIQKEMGRWGGGMRLNMYQYVRQNVGRVHGTKRGIQSYALS